MGLNDEIQRHVKAIYLEPARLRGDDTIRIKAGDIHRELHWVNRVPSVCTTLASQKFQRETGLELISKNGPPSGNSTTVVFTYRLRSPGAATRQLEKREGRINALYGIAKDVFRDLGGGENFLRSEREKLDFRHEGDEKKKAEDER